MGGGEQRKATKRWIAAGIPWLDRGSSAAPSFSALLDLSLPRRSLINHPFDNQFKMPTKTELSLVFLVQAISFSKYDSFQDRDHILEESAQQLIVGQNHTIQSRHTVTTWNPNSLTPSEFDDELDDSDLPRGHIRAYPCKLLSCPDYGKSWQLRSNFLAHLQDREAHRTTATTPAARRLIELA